MSQMNNDDTLCLEKQSCFSLYSAANAMVRSYRPALLELDLTYPQYLAMLVLWERDGLTVGEVSTRLLTDPGSLTPLLKRLETEGLIRRTRSKEDERVVLLTLTDQGKALHKKAQRIPHCILAASGINLEQLKALQQDLLGLRGNLQDAL